MLVVLILNQIQLQIYYNVCACELGYVSLCVDVSVVPSMYTCVRPCIHVSIHPSVGCTFVYNTYYIKL